MKRILSAALACAVLLAGCAAPASTSGAPGGTSAVSAPEPTPAPTPSPAPKEVSLEEWRAAMPANAPSFSHESIDLTLDEQVLWPEQVELLIWAWEGTLEEADAAFGLPAGSFSLWEDTYYPPPEGAIAIRAEGYVLPKVPMERVTVDVPWLMYDFGWPNQYDLPADLDEQALCALAAAYYFLYNFNGMHHGFDPCEFAPGLSFPYPSKRLIAPQIQRPAPRAITRVCNTSTALLKKPILLLPESLEFHWFSVSSIRKSRNENRFAAPDSGVSFQFLVLYFHSDFAD